jgi:sec-independent protein translocase protein TatC
MAPATELDDGRMTLVEHLTELRSRIIKAVVAVLAGAVVAFVAYNHIFRFLIEPYCSSLSDEARRTAIALTGDPDASCKLVARDPLEGFGVRITVSTYTGISLAMPVILWQLWRFVAPGLYRHERKYARGFVVSGALLFAMGAGLAYWTLPKALQWLADIGGQDLVSQYSPKFYLSFVVKMMVGFGIGFEFPILLCFLQMVGVVTPQWLRKYWRHSLVGIVALVALVTPSGDPISLTVLSVPMYLFYEIAILYGRLWQRRKRKAGASAGAVT